MSKKVVIMATTSKVINDDEQSVNDNSKHRDKDSKNDVNSAENSFCFTEVDSSIDLTKQFGNPLLNADVQISLLKVDYKRVSKIMSTKTAKPKIWIILPSGEAYFVWKLLE